MTTLRTGFPIPFYAMSGEPSSLEAPKAIFGIVDFAVSPQWSGDLLEQMQQKRIQSVRTIYVDLINCANNVTLFWPQTQQRMILPAGGWGYIPVIVSDKSEFVLTGTSPDVFRIHLVNKDIDPIIYDPISGIVPVSSIIVSASPRLIGRFSAGAGPAEEISLTAPFSIAGGAFSAQAAAQYNVMGRRTAGAGAFEDSTRTQLNIAGTDLANTFVPAQAFSDVISQSITSSITYPLDFTKTDNSFGPFIRLTHHQTVPAISTLGGVQWFGTSSLGVDKPFVGFTAESRNITSGAEAALYSVSTIIGGTFAARYFVGAGFYTPNAIGTDLGPDTINAAGVVRTGQFTVATLPAAATAGAGARAYVTDANASAFGAAVVGGGAVGVPVYSTGAAWNVG